MENNKRSRVQNMNDFVNNISVSDETPAETEIQQIPPEENTSGVIQRTVYPTPGHSVSASRYAGSAYRAISDYDAPKTEYDAPDDAYSREMEAAREISEAYARRVAEIAAEKSAANAPARRSSAHTSSARRTSAGTTLKHSSDNSSKPASHTTRVIKPKRNPQAAAPQDAEPRRRISRVTPDDAEEIRISAPAETAAKAAAPSKSSRDKSAPAQKSASARTKNNPQEPEMKRNTRTTAANRKYSDIVDERHSRKAAEIAEMPEEGKKKRHVFRTLVIIYAVLLFIVVAAGLVFLTIYLHHFEASQPNKVAESIAANYSTSARLSSFIQANADKIDCIDDLNDFADAYVRYVDGKKISYVETSTSTADIPAYNLVSDGTIIGSFTLKKTGTGAFNTAEWSLDKYDIVTSFPLGYTLSIYVPQGSTVQVNETVLNESYISASGTPEILQNSVSFMKNAPVFDTYSVPVLTDTPKVIAKDASGTELTLTESKQDKVISYVSGVSTDPGFRLDVEELVNKAIEVWGLYFINMDDTLDQYIMEGTELYANIFGSEDMDPILTWLYNFEEIDDYEFEYIESDNYQRFTDDCFTVDVRYKLDITFTEEGMEDNNQQLDATWVWVADGDSWSITDIFYK